MARARPSTRPETDTTSHKVAREFVDRLNRVLNRTVSDSRLSLIPRPGPARFLIARLENGQPVPLELFGSSYRLYVEHVVEVDDDGLHTDSYTYTLQWSEDRASSLIRWEHSRERPPGYRYVLSHVHVNGRFTAGCVAMPLPKLHIPTSRIPLELVLWHLIVEWGVKPKDPDWQKVLQDSLAKFEQSRRAPLWPGPPATP